MFCSKIVTQPWRLELPQELHLSAIVQTTYFQKCYISLTLIAFLLIRQASDAFWDTITRTVPEVELLEEYKSVFGTVKSPTEQDVLPPKYHKLIKRQ